MIAWWLAVLLLVAVLVFEAGRRWQLRQERGRQRRLDEHMQSRTDERVRAVLHGDFRPGQ